MQSKKSIKKITLTCMSVVLVASLMSACSSGRDASNVQTTDSNQTDASENQGTENSGTASQIANPWEDADAAGIKELLGISFREPDNCGDITYRICREEGLVQMTYQDSNNIDFCARAEKTDSLEDISGMYFNWESEESCSIGTCDGTLKQASDGENTVELCLWYDSTAGISYSLSAEGSNMEGIDLTWNAWEIYQQTYTPAQTLADAVGEYTCTYDDSTITIQADGTVSISIYRLAVFDGTASEPEDGVLTFEITDPNNGDMTMTFDTFTGILTVTSSTWENLPEGPVGEFARSGQ